MRKEMLATFLSIVFVLLPHEGQPAPTEVDDDDDDYDEFDDILEQNAYPTIPSEGTGLEYAKYLKEVVEILETDPNFKAKIEKANTEDIKSGVIAKHLHFVKQDIRDKLDELKRQEIARLRKLAAKYVSAKQAHLIKGGFAGHLHHDVDDGFGEKDLEKLIKKTFEDLQANDKQQHDQYKRYQMGKDFRRQMELKALNEDERKKQEQHYREMKLKHRDHEKINHPGSEEQFKEVWKESDQMNPENFDYKTFFALHDINGDGFLDPAEVEAILVGELDKMYNSSNEEDDMEEREEELLRMREHVDNELDKNKDGLLTLEEFMAAGKQGSDWHEEGWETVDERAEKGKVYSQEEYKQMLDAYAKRQEQKKHGEYRPPQTSSARPQTFRDKMKAIDDEYEKQIQKKKKQMQLKYYYAMEKERKLGKGTGFQKQRENDDLKIQK